MTEPLAPLFRDGPAVYTVPAGRPFLRDLARPLIEAYKDDPAGLSDVTIYLPSRRATRAMAQSFLDQAGEGAILLPRLRTLGDVDEADLIVSQAPLAAETALPPAAEGVERRLVLARFLRRARQAQSGPVPHWPAALAAADELCRLLDDFHTEGVCFSKLADLVDDDAVPKGAAHWDHSVKFLSVVTDVWPAWLAQQGRMDGAERRRKLVEALADVVAADETAKGPVIVAGSLGTVPATARLMARVAASPRGVVVLPGLDASLDDRAWAEIEPPHPQALFKTLLRDRFGDMDRRDVAVWPDSEGDAGEESRRAFLSLILRPAEATDDWYGRLEGFKRTDDVRTATRGLRTATAASEDEEAGFVSLLMREVLADPGRTAVLVTPDRQLARRVRVKLGLWGVDVDDSGGTPLSGTFRGTYLRALARWLEAPSDPARIAALTGHELCLLGETKSDHGRAARALNRALRGARPGPGLDGLLRTLRDDDLRVPSERPGARDEAIALAERLGEAAAPFWAAGTDADRLQAHVEVAQAMAASARQPGEERLWRYEDGEALAVHLSGLLAQGLMLPDLDARYADVFDALLTGPVVRPRGGGHPRLKILGLLEARLQHADRVILAGLNEGVWPDDARTDPFLSRPMREALGLPSPEMVIGRAAHDFSQLAAAPEVWMTRSARRGKSPAEPSRWMVRFESFIAASTTRTDAGPTLRAWLARLHAHDGKAMPAKPPKPCPPLAARPTTFSVSEVEKLLRDPYAIYAKRVLSLPALKPMVRGMDAAVRGEFYHEVFHRFATSWADERPADVVAVLTSIAETLFEERHVAPALRAFWRPRMRVGFEAFAAFDAEARAAGRLAGAEVAGEWTFEAHGQTYTLRGRADRIDLGEDGRALIFDYKTGGVPTIKQDGAFIPQLTLTAMMVEGGAFAAAGVQKGTGTHRIAYLDSLPRRVPDEVFPDKHSAHGEKLSEHVAETYKGFTDHLAHYADEATPYLSQPRAFMADPYGDYDHLARRGEWAGAAEAEE